MSKGPGKIERAIRALFDDNPDRAFIVEELVEHCYPDAEFVEKKHRVGVLRAAHKVVARDPDWQAWVIGGGRGHNVGLCFFNYDNVTSYALGRLIRMEVVYRAWRQSRWHRYVRDYDTLRALLDREDRRELMAPGGAWHRHVEMHRAKRDGDTKRLAQLTAEQEADRAATMGKIKAAAAGVGIITPGEAPAPDSEVFRELARVLAQFVRGVERAAGANDPDVRRRDLAATIANLRALEDACGHPEDAATVLRGYFERVAERERETTKAGA